MEKETAQQLKNFKRTYDNCISSLQGIEQTTPILVRGFQEIHINILGNQLLGCRLDDTQSFIDLPSKDTQNSFSMSRLDNKNSNEDSISSKTYSKGVCQAKKYKNNQNILLWPCFTKNQEIQSQQILVNVINVAIVRRIYNKNRNAKVVFVLDVKNICEEYIKEVEVAIKDMFDSQKDFEQSKHSILLYICNVHDDNDLKNAKKEISKNKNLKDLKQIGFNFTNNINDKNNIQQIQEAIQDLQTTNNISFEDSDNSLDQQFEHIYDQIRKFISENYECGNKQEEDKYSVEINENEIARGSMMLLYNLANFGANRAKEILKESVQIFKEHYQDFKNYLNKEFNQGELDEEEYNDLYDDYLKEFALMASPFIKDFNMKKDLIEFDKDFRLQKLKKSLIEYSFDENMENSFDQDNQQQIIIKKDEDNFDEQKHQKTILDDDKMDKQFFEDSSCSSEGDQDLQGQEIQTIEQNYLKKVRDQDKLNDQQFQLEECIDLCLKVKFNQESQQELKKMKKELSFLLKELQIKEQNNFDKTLESLHQQQSQNKKKRIQILRQCAKLYLQHRKKLLDDRKQKFQDRAKKILQKYNEELDSYQSVVQKKKNFQQGGWRQLISIMANSQDVEEFKNICDKMQKDKMNINSIIDEQKHSLLYNALLFKAKEIQKLLEEQYKVNLNNEDQKAINQNFCEAIKKFQFDAIVVKIQLGHNVDENFNCENFTFDQSLIPPEEQLEDIFDVIDPLQNMVSYDNINALDAAILFNNFEVVKVLVEQGKCKLNNEDNETKLLPPLMLSILTGNHQIYDYLYQKCNKGIKANLNEYNLAHIAILSQNIEVLKKLDSHYYQEQDNDQYLPLHLAVEVTTNYEVLQQVLEKTENLNILNDQQQNAVTMAILNYNQLSLIKYVDYNELCQYWDNMSEKKLEAQYFDEIDLNESLYKTKTKLDVILEYCKKNKNKVLDLFQQSESKVIPYDYAFLKGEHVVNKLIEYDQQTANKLTEEQKRIYSSSREQFVKQFFQKPKIKRQINSGILKDQIFRLVFDLYRENLGEFSIENKICDEEGNTFLHHLTLESMSEQIKEQVKTNSPLLEVKNKQGETPFFIAATLQSIETMKVLIDKGVDINAINLEKQTPLIRSITDECFRSAEFLLKQGQIDKDIVDQYELKAEDYLNKMLNNDYMFMKENSQPQAKNLKAKF